jgi:hypothetical protein
MKEIIISLFILCACVIFIYYASKFGKAHNEMMSAREKLGYEAKEVTYDKCQYVIFTSPHWNYMGTAHKGNCNNHREKQ